MIRLVKIARKYLEVLRRKTGIPPFNLRISLVTMASVGMALGLVGSCNTGTGTLLHGAYAATGGVAGMTHWQIRSYSRSLVKDPSKLLDLSGAEMASIFKTPDLERHDYPAVVWQFANDDCVLDVYFKTSKAGNDLMKERVVHYETRSRNGNGIKATSCMHSMVSVK